MPLTAPAFLANAMTCAASEPTGVVPRTATVSASSAMTSGSRCFMAFLTSAADHDGQLAGDGAADAEDDPPAAARQPGRWSGRDVGHHGVGDRLLDRGR